MRLFTMLFLCLTIVQTMAAESVQHLVDRAIEYHGGVIYTSSETSLVITSKSGSFHVISKTDGGLFDHRVARVRNGHQEIVRVTNDTVEITSDGTTTVAHGTDAEKLRTFAYERVYFPFLPFRLNDPGVIKTDLGDEVWEGRTLRKVKVTFEGATGDGDEYVYWFDPKSARLEQYAYSFRNNDGGLRFRRAGNYRRIGGVLFFDAENLGLSGNAHRVDEINPAFVAANMSRISTVTLSDVEVAPVRH